MCFLVCLCVCVGDRAYVWGRVYWGLFSSCRTTLWDSIRLPCIAAHRQLRKSYFRSWNKALCGFLPQQSCCACMCKIGLSVHACLRVYSWVCLCVVSMIIRVQRVPVPSDVCLCSDPNSKVGLTQTDNWKALMHFIFPQGCVQLQPPCIAHGGLIHTCD